MVLHVMKLMELLLRTTSGGDDEATVMMRGGGGKFDGDSLKCCPF